MRYLDEFQNISEVFIGLLNLERITSEHIGEAILKSYRELGLDVKKCRGQCYDGAANMQSKKKGVASVILLEAQNSIVTHCFSHNLNLSLAASCNLAIIDNILEAYKSITIHFNSSPKKEKLLKHIIITRCESIGRRKVLVGMCKTCCTEREVSYKHFYLPLSFIVEALEIINGIHPSIHTFDEVFTKGWDSNSKKEATAYINALISFGLIVGITSSYRLQHPVTSITQKHQGRTIDIVKAYQEFQSCILYMRVVRDKIEEEILVIYRQAERIATSLDISPSVPRTVSTQMHRSNIPANTSEEYYRRVMAIPVLETFIAEMNFGFNELN